MQIREERYINEEEKLFSYHIFLFVGVERILQWIRHEWRESGERRVLGQSHEIQFCNKRNTHGEF